jgi:hypothetical protein
MPPLDEEYAAWPTCPSRAAIEAVLMMTPRWPFSSGSVAAILSAAVTSTLAGDADADLFEVGNRLRRPLLGASHPGDGLVDPGRLGVVDTQQDPGHRVHGEVVAHRQAG